LGKGGDDRKFREKKGTTGGRLESPRLREGICTRRKKKSPRKFLLEKGKSKSERKGFKNLLEKKGEN